MNSTSSLYNSIISGLHSFEVKLNISGTDYGMDVLTSLSASRTVFGSGSPCLGLAPAGELSASLYTASASILRMAGLRPYFRAVNETQQSEWIAKGACFVGTTAKDAATGAITFTAS